MPGDGICMECGASVRPKLSNCNPPVNPCPDCGQCECLSRIGWLEYTEPTA